MKSSKTTNTLLAIIAINLCFLSFMQMVPKAQANSEPVSRIDPTPVYITDSTGKIEVGVNEVGNDGKGSLYTSPE